MARLVGSGTTRAAAVSIGPLCIALCIAWAGLAFAETEDPAGPPIAEPAAGAAPAAAPAPPGAAERAEAPALLPGLLVAPNVPSAEGLDRAIAAWKAHVRAGNADLEGRRWQAAEKHFRAALVLDPSDSTLLSKLAAALDGMGQRRQATITLRKAVSLAFTRVARAERWADVARNAESRGLTTEAIDAWMRARSLLDAPDPAIDARLAELLKSQPVQLMSPRTLCPQLLDDWGCSPSTRPAEGELRCQCTIERQIRTPAAVSGGIRTVDDYGLARLEQRTLLAAALIRLRGAGTSIVDTQYLAVETGSGGWQLVSRVVEGWQPGAAYTGRDGALIEFGFRALDGAEAEGPMLVVRGVNRFAEALFDRQALVRARAERTVVCHARGKMRCVDFLTAHQLSGRPFPGAAGTPEEVAWRLDSRFRPDGALVVSPKSGALSSDLEPVIGTHALEALDDMPRAIVTPLR